MSYQLKVLRDFPIGFWPLDESTGSDAFDISGCQNDGQYHGDLLSNFLPLVPGGQRGSLINSSNYITFPITKDYYGSENNGSIADKYSKDNDFSLEVWFYPKINKESIVSIFANPQYSIGIFYENGDIIFKFGGYETRYTIPFLSKAHHIVATYSLNSINLYYDSNLVDTKVLGPYFTVNNTGITFNSGPAPELDSFIIDAPAVYRYALSKDQIYIHYNASENINPIQIVSKNNGIYFKTNDENVQKHFSYSYPYSKGLDSFVSNDLTYNSIEKSLYLTPTTTSQEKEVYITDYIQVPIESVLTSSKIEWYGTNGIKVQTSIDGENWKNCTNGQTIPQYRINSFSGSGQLYIKITFYSSDSSKHIPKLQYFNISFYKDKKVYSQNSSEYIEPLGYDYDLSSSSYSVLSRHRNNGIRCPNIPGFKISTNKNIKTIEFLYTPEYITNILWSTVNTITAEGIPAYEAEITDINPNAIPTDSTTEEVIQYQRYLIAEDETETEYSWDSSFLLSKNNIKSIYVNGVEKTSETEVLEAFEQGHLHHVAIVLDEPITGDIKFGIFDIALFNNISLYENELNEDSILENYNLYISRPSNIIEDTFMTLTENDPKLYDNDWVLVQNI